MRSLGFVQLLLARGRFLNARIYSSSLRIASLQISTDIKREAVSVHIIQHQLGLIHVIRPSLKSGDAHNF